MSGPSRRDLEQQLREIKNTTHEEDLPMLSLAQLISNAEACDVVDRERYIIELEGQLYQANYLDRIEGIEL